MATSLVRIIARPVERSPRPALRPPHVFELMGAATSAARRLSFDVMRTPQGVEVRCRCEPVPEGLEVEVCGGDKRLAQLVPADGRLSIVGLPTDCRHVNVVVRGGGLPAIAFLKLPVD